MKVAAIISEYNPFHNGHMYQAKTARRELGCDGIAALMSGSFVQRGDFAIFPKELRASAAISGGVDLVLENPAAFVLRSAEGYASAAIHTLSSLGCVDYLVFGAECGDLGKLLSVAEFFADESDAFKSALSKLFSGGMSFAAARAKAAAAVLGNSVLPILNQPNNLLAIEYLKAMIRQKSAIKPFLIKRVGNAHDGEVPSGEFASASLIRKGILSADKSVMKYVPSSASALYQSAVPHTIKNAEKAIISGICLTPKSTLASYLGISEGLENRIKAEAMKHGTIDGLIDGIKSKRYAYSRLQRAVLCAYLGISAESASEMPRYIKILDFNRVGQAILNTAKRTASLPLAKSASPLLKNPPAMRQWQRETEYDRIYDIFV